jgi:dephospho-CoA kinase
MITFGLTGGIASGKSTVSKTFQKHGIPMVDADVVARQVVEPGHYGLDGIVDLFGHDILLGDGTLNRIKLGELVFSNPDMTLRTTSMAALNSLMAPLITQESARQLSKLHDEGHPIVGYDAALICEMGNADKYRPLIVVACSRAAQVARLMSRNSLTREQAMDRISAQMPVEQRAKMANFVIHTEGSIEDSIKQTEACITLLKQQENIS